MIQQSDAVENDAANLPNTKKEVILRDSTSFTGDKVLGNVENEFKIQMLVYKLINTYRAKNNGEYPRNFSSVEDDAGAKPKDYGFESFADLQKALINPDNRFAENFAIRKAPTQIIATIILNKRYDATPIGSPHIPRTMDVLAFTDIYVHENTFFQIQKETNQKTLKANPVGFYIVLWDNGNIEKIPYDRVLYVPNNGGYSRAFSAQAGVPSTALTYEEFNTIIGPYNAPPVGYPISFGTTDVLVDNGLYEGVVTLSRLLGKSLEREAIWKQFGLAQEQFNLDEVLAGAAGLNLPLQKRALSLDELQKLGAPAIFEDKERARLATLAALDSDMAIIQDEGRTRIVARETLAKRYGGNVLVKDTAPSALQIDDAIRAITFKSKAETKEQIVTLANSGQAPLHLQIERPIPGVSEATLDKDEIAPGQSAQLKLQIRWREVLKSDTQNVFVTIKSDDAARPRAMLGFKLSLAKTP